MPPRGRRPKPSKIKELEGNPGKRPLNQNEPQPPAVQASQLKPPYGRLSKQARRLWKDLAPSLEALGVLTQADLAAFELLCNHYGFAVEAAAILRAEGLTLQEPAAWDKETGEVTAWRTKKHPVAQIFRENSTAFRMMAGEFGLTPSSRARLDVDPPPPKESLFKEFERIVNKGH